MKSITIEYYGDYWEDSNTLVLSIIRAKFLIININIQTRDILNEIYQNEHFKTM